MNCTRILHYIAPPASWSRVGRWIGYTAAEVAKRRAARWVIIVTCVAMPPAVVVPWIVGPAPHPLHAPQFVDRMPPGPTWRATGEPVHPQDVPEPGTAALLAVGVFGIWRMRR